VKKLYVIAGISLIITALSWLLTACKKEQNIKNLTLKSQEIPVGFPAPLYTFQDNPLSEEGFELGRKLFYDGRLSIDNEHPCSSCHQQIAGFGTFEHDRSHGVNNTHTLRNAPVLFNLAWNSYLHWDGAYKSLYDEAAQPLHGAHEMGETYAGIINKINDDKTYRELFRKVFRSSIIRPEYILKALQQFTGNLVSANSKYDKYKRGEYVFTPQENAGYSIYLTNCSSCHPEPLFTDNSFRNIGLPVDPFLNDFGRMMITGNVSDSLKFKVPTLRNSNVSSNYMHDGRFGTLGQVINHYRTGVQPGPTLDPALVGGISMTNTDANNLFQFLKALTDSSFLTDTRLSDPD
jgi:cytochrome c peroxidase